MEKFFIKASGQSTFIVTFSPPRKLPKPCLYTSFWLSLNELLMIVDFWLLIVTTGNKLTTDRTMPSTKNTVASKRRILAKPSFFIKLPSHR